LVKQELLLLQLWGSLQLKLPLASWQLLRQQRPWASGRLQALLPPPVLTASLS
jgi:hypothetical protein